jgi:hypothetical protein
MPQCSAIGPYPQPAPSAIGTDGDIGLGEMSLARVTVLEPATSGVTGRRSNQLSYTRSDRAQRVGRRRECVKQQVAQGGMRGESGGGR